MAYNATLGYDPDKDYTQDGVAQQLVDLATRLQEQAGGVNNFDFAAYKQTEDYGELEDLYRYQGKRAMQDTLGQVSGRTGGMASSYATTAAQQAENDWMARLLSVAQEGYETEYNKRKTAYDDEYARGKAQIDDEYNRYQAARTDAQNRINQYFQYGGTMGALDPELLKLSGYTSAEAQAMYQYHAEQAALERQALLAEQEKEQQKTTASSGGGSGGTGGNTTYIKNQVSDDGSKVFIGDAGGGKYSKNDGSWVSTSEVEKGLQTGKYVATNDINGNTSIVKNIWDRNS